MRTRIFLLLAITTALVPSNALAKGASEASVTGPGLAAPLVFTGYGPSNDPADEPADAGAGLAKLSTESGIYASIFEEAPGIDNAPSSGTLAKKAPAGDLGPRYTLTYTFPVSEQEANYIVQHVYPYAERSPLTYTPPGQAIFGRKVREGWLAAGTGLKDLLVDAGLPIRAPTLTESAGANAASARDTKLYLAVFAGLATMIAFSALIWRRKLGTILG